MEIMLEELYVRLNGKEERPLFGQFKVITNKDLPKLSDNTKTQMGRFKKEKNETKYKWNYSTINSSILMPTGGGQEVSMKPKDLMDIMAGKTDEA